MELEAKHIYPGMNSYMVCGTRFDIPDRYELIKPIGQGAYGVVCAALDKNKNRKVAIKKICKAFDCLTDAIRTLREIKLLRHFRNENVISIEDMFKPQSYETFEDVYVVNELMDTDMHQIISSPQELSDDHCQYFIYQLLRGLKYIHSGQVLHRDLKPSNLLLNGNCDLKICDLGLARVIDAACGHEAFMTQYVATRWYRAPEIMLSWREYTQAIDVWAAGCIFGELLLRKPLFPGRDYIHQIQLITETLGTPSMEDIAGIQSDKARRYLMSLPVKKAVDFNQHFGKFFNPSAIDLLKQMLAFDPDKRITCEQALAHPYFESLHDPSDEPTCSKPFDFEWEKEPLTKELVKCLVFKEITLVHPELFYEIDNPLANANHPDHATIRAAYQQSSLTTDMENMDLFAQPMDESTMNVPASPASITQPLNGFSPQVNFNNSQTSTLTHAQAYPQMQQTSFMSQQLNLPANSMQ
eukprot:Ihof_evm16s24 gene=Ihof_evmTU16s24